MNTIDEDPNARGGRPLQPVAPALSSSPLLQDLLDFHLVLGDDLDRLPRPKQEALAECLDSVELLRLLVRDGLLTQYQADRVRAGTTHGLVMGNYRVLDRLGAGGMGVVFKAEHRLMRRPVAIKVLPMSAGQDERLLQRFFAEIQAVARLCHPNIVAAMDAGEAPSPVPNMPTLHYLVMEYVPGQDLDDHVRERGPMPPVLACAAAYQVVSALAEANRHGMIHRDIKPSNVRLTPDGQAKLLDFGLARHWQVRITKPGTAMGTIDYMAPEQAQDAAAVDIRADLYALGATLFWSLTGRSPFPQRQSFMQVLTERLSQPPPSPRQVRPDVPAELDAVVVRLLAPDPGDRYATPEEVMRALLPFLRSRPREDDANEAGAAAGHHRVLIADDEDQVRSFCQLALEADGTVCEQVPDGLAALAAVADRPFDLILLDVDMPGMSGAEVCRRLREGAAGPRLKVVMMSGRATADELALMVAAGADDYLTKPFSVVQLQTRVNGALRLGDAQQRGESLNKHVVVAGTERPSPKRGSAWGHADSTLLLTLARLAESRSGESRAHLLRLPRYCRCLAEEAMRNTAFEGQIDPDFIDLLEGCAPLHDIGKVGLPDAVLLKAGKLSPEERLIMQNHATIGADALREATRGHEPTPAFVRMAVEVVRHHHERFDGQGYPDHLAGEDIPLAARLVAVADVYDALRSRRPYRPAFGHAAAVQIMRELSAGQFDPHLLRAFARCAARFERIYDECPD